MGANKILKKELNHNNRKWLKIVLIIAPIAIFCLALIFKDTIVYLAELIPKCMFRKVTGYACPGCGNTRSVFALLNFDILSSLRYNITPIVAIIIGFIFYLELILSCFNKKVIIFPRKDYVIYIILTGMLIYFLVRNFIPFLRV